MKGKERIAEAFRTLIGEILKKYPAVDEVSLFSELVSLYYENIQSIASVLSDSGIEYVRVRSPIPHFIWEKKQEDN